MEKRVKGRFIVLSRLVSKEEEKTKKYSSFWIFFYWMTQ